MARIDDDVIRGSRGWAVLLATLMVASSCTSDREAAPSGDAGQSPPAGQPSSDEARPATRSDTISIEGMAEPVLLHLVREPPGFPSPFSTYAPEGFEVQSEASDGGQAIRFVAAFGGRSNPAAYLEVVPLAEGISLEEATRSEAAELSGSEAIPPAEAAPWALAEWRSRGSDTSGPFTALLRLTRHQSRFYHVLMRYPLEYGDGFPPRAAVILEEWRWDDGTPLTGSTPR